MRAFKTLALLTVLLLVSPLAVRAQDITATGYAVMFNTGSIEDRPADCIISPGLPPQDSTDHNSLYLETGEENGFTDLCVSSLPEFTLILGAWQVGDMTEGVYFAFDVEREGYVHLPDFHNGFVLLILDEWAQDEFRKRLVEAGAEDWDTGHVSVPSDWMEEFEDFSPSAND